MGRLFSRSARSKLNASLPRRLARERRRLHRGHQLLCVARCPPSLVVVQALVGTSNVAHTVSPAYLCTSSIPLPKDFCRLHASPNAPLLAVTVFSAALLSFVHFQLSTGAWAKADARSVCHVAFV